MPSGSYLAEAILKKISLHGFITAFCFGIISFASTANAEPVSCNACTSDGGLGYSRTCCVTRVDPNPSPNVDPTYQYCRVMDCLPGQDAPDEIRESDAPGFTLPIHDKYPDAPRTIKIQIPAVPHKE